MEKSSLNSNRDFIFEDLTQPGSAPRPQRPKVEQRGLPDVGHSQRPATHSPAPSKPNPKPKK